MPYMNMDEAAKFLGVNRRSIARYIAQGDLKAEKNAINGRIRLEESEVKRFQKAMTSWKPVTPAK